MKTYFISENIEVSIPYCCYLKYEASGWHQEILKSFSVIQETKVGQNLLQEIARGSHKIFITTHPLEEECDSFARQNKLLKAKAVDLSASKDPTKGSSSFIFINPEAKDPLIYTYHHFVHCVVRDRISPSCNLEGRHCIRRAKLPEMLFHELVHGKNMQKGWNQQDVQSIDPIFPTEEEYVAVKEENAFMLELLQKEGKSERDAELDLRYGYKCPKVPSLFKRVTQHLSSAVGEFATRVANFANNFFKTVSVPFQPRVSTPREEPTLPQNDEDLYS